MRERRRVRVVVVREQQVRSRWSQWAVVVDSEVRREVRPVSVRGLEDRSREVREGRWSPVISY